MRQLKIKRIEEVLGEIWLGKLPHDQSTYTGLYPEKDYCPRCVCGWAVEKWGKKEERAIDYFEEGMQIFGLTFSEAKIMFDASATKGLHEKILEAFRAERRFEVYSKHKLIINISPWVSPLNEDLEPYGTRNCCIGFTARDEDYSSVAKSIKDFLGNSTEKVKFEF